MKTFIDGKIVNALSVQNQDVTICKQEVRRLLSEKEKIAVHALIQNSFEVEVTAKNFGGLEKLEDTIYFLKGDEVEIVKSFEELQTFDFRKSVLRSIQAELVRLVTSERTDIILEAPICFSDRFSPKKVKIKGLYLGTFEDPCIITPKKTPRALEDVLLSPGNESEVLQLLEALTKIVS